MPAGRRDGMTAARVLLVKDDAMIGLALAETLAALGYAVCATEAGAVAAAAKAQAGPDDHGREPL